MTDHYATLGVDKAADDATIKRAYRKRAAKAHPDRAGGKAEDMAAVNRAYEVLADPLLRARYDNTGQDVPLPTIEREAQDTLLQIFRQVLDEESRTDILGAVRGIAANVGQQIATNEGKQLSVKRRLEKLSGKVRSKGKQNLVQMLIDQQLTQVAGQLDNLKRAREVHAKVEEMLSAYEQDAELSTASRPVMFSALPQGWGR